MKRVIVWLPVLAWLASCGGSGGSNNSAGGQPPPPPPILINMDAVLDSFIANNRQVSSVAMLAVRNGQVFYSHTAGFADVARSRAPTEATLYKTSSIAKLVIAIAVMQQVDLGLLDLDRDVGDYLPFAVRNPAFPGKVITARALLQHSAGLAIPDFGAVSGRLFESFDPSTVLPLHPLIEDVLTPGHADYSDAIWLGGEPGTIHRNSNTGMVLLTYLVERLSGLHFNDYAKTYIFLPLGMTRTSHHFPDLDPNEIAAHYDLNDNPVGQVSSWFYPISGLFTSTGDWANFMRAILAGGTFNGNRILQQASVDAMLTMTTPVNNQLPYGSRIGLIWREAQPNAGWYGHTGAGSQVTHVTEINPASITGYVLFTNEGLADSLVGPGSALNRTIHQWLEQP